MRDDRPQFLPPSRCSSGGASHGVSSLPGSVEELDERNSGGGNSAVWLRSRVEAGRREAGAGGDKSVSLAIQVLHDRIIRSLMVSFYHAVVQTCCLTVLHSQHKKGSTMRSDMAIPLASNEIHPPSHMSGSSSCFIITWTAG